MSDSSGIFNFTLFPGKYEIECRRIGYANSLKTISLDPGDNELVVFFNMKQKPVETEKVTITGKMFKDLDDVKNYELKNGDILNIPVFFESDALRAVQALPGVTSPHDFSSLIYLRGGNFDETMMSIDEAPAYNLFHLGGVFGSINPDIVESEILYPSNYPVNYQGVLSGVLNIRTKSGNHEKLKGSASIGILSSKICLDGPLSMGSFVVSARRTYPDFYLSLLQKTSFPYYFYDLIGKFTLPYDNNHLFSVSAFYTKDVFNPFYDAEPGVRENKEMMNWGDLVIQLSYDYLFKKGSLKAAVYNSESFFKANSKRYPDFTGVNYRIPGDSIRLTQHININNRINDFTLKTELEYIMMGQQLSLGAEYKNITGKYYWNIKENELSDLIDHPLAGVFFDFAPEIYDSRDNTGVLSLFVSDKIQLTDDLTICPGYRASYLSKIKTFLNSPFLMVNYNPVKDIKLTAGYGRYFEYFYTRRDIINGKMLNPFAIYFIVDDPNRIPSSDHFSLGLKMNLPPYDFRFEIEGYYKTRNNISASDALTRTIMLNRGYSYGIDILLKNDNEIVNGLLAYSFSRSVKDNGIYQYYAEYDRTHNLKISLNHNLSERWKLNILWIYATGMTYTPVIGKYFGTGYGSKNFEGGIFPEQRTLEFIYGKKNTKRYPNYHRLDMGLTGSFIWGTVIAKPFLQVLNVYNSSNPFSFNPNPLNTNLENGINLGSMIIPTIGLTLEF